MKWGNFDAVNGDFSSKDREEREDIKQNIIRRK
jgi:hypothetical protein